MRAFDGRKQFSGKILITEIFFLKSIINSSEMRIFHYFVQPSTNSGEGRVGVGVFPTQTHLTATFSEIQ